MELAQLAAIAIASEMKVEQLALVPFSFPTYANALGRAVVLAARQLDLTSDWAPDPLAEKLTPSTSSHWNQDLADSKLHVRCFRIV